MKFNPVIVRTIMRLQFDELQRLGGANASTVEEHYPFQPHEVDEVFFSNPETARNTWFRLKDGRYLDVRAEIAEEEAVRAGAKGSVIPPSLKEMMEALDVMDKLPLALIPLSSATLGGARLVKNVRLDTMVEVHSGKTSGSLQIRPEDLRETYPRFAADQKIISSLAALHSYDVFSLRMNLRKLGIGVDESALELSEPMKAKLDAYTPEFTLPLVREIFGDDGADIRDRRGLARVFRDPDRARAAQRLKMMSQKTRIPVEALPQFLEHYADSFVSVAYYQHSFEAVVPTLKRCIQWLRDPHTAQRGGALCKKVEEAIAFLITTIRERLRLFRESFGNFWHDMTADTFARMRQEIEAKHVGTGAMLCGLAVKMRHWSQVFHSDTSGGPATRLQYLGSDMEPGLTRLCEFAAQA
jgi:hypothetical protein